MGGGVSQDRRFESVGLYISFVTGLSPIVQDCRSISMDLWTRRGATIDYSQVIGRVFCFVRVIRDPLI